MNFNPDLDTLVLPLNIKMFKLLVVAGLVAVATAAPFTFNRDLDTHWMEFKDAFQKKYSSQEELYRRMVFEKNMNFIRDHNMEADLGRKTFRVGVNEFTDLTNGEFVGLLTGYTMRNTTTGSTFLDAENILMPKTVDWRKKGYVTPVKNQKQCGSCWAFSATGSLEGQHFKKTGKLVSLSEQNLVDCSGAEGNQGCEGGLMDQAFAYIKKNGGIDTEESYPYEAQDDKCRFKKDNVGATLTGHTDIPSGNEQALQKAVATVGPISVAIDASHMSFQLYKTGVYYEPDCSSTALDHGVLAVGFGSGQKDENKGHGKYWLVKNSWGASWGMDGYIHMSRDRDNNCGIATQASYPLV